MPKVLIVYYSRTGTTRKVEAELAAMGGWDLERVIDTRSREGLLGYLRAGLDALFERHTTLAPSREDPASYDFVVVGTPVWNGSVSTPIRTWLAEHAGRLPPLAFFATEGGRGGQRAFDKMASIAPRRRSPTSSRWPRSSCISATSSAAASRPVWRRWSPRCAPRSRPSRRRRRRKLRRHSTEAAPIARSSARRPGGYNHGRTR